MKVRSKVDNIAYILHLKEAISQIQQATDCIAYECHPGINKRTIAKLAEAADLLDACANACVFKP